jgi:hypothetical protein
VIIGVPCLLLAVGIAVALSSILDPPEAKPVVEPTPQELATKILPNIDKNLKIESNNDVEVLEIRVDHTGGSRIFGVVRNTTNHEIASAHMVVDLTDTNGSQVGGVDVHMENIPASKTKAFSAPVAQRTAAFALVREVGIGK